MHFFDDLIKGKVVVINFIFTSCSDSCPLETARLRQVQKLLGDRVGKDIFFYSISIDPLSDTPEVLKSYAQRFQIGPGWQFLTGEFADVTELRQKLGLFIEGVDNGRSKDHNLSLIVGNQQTGRWMKASPSRTPGSWPINWPIPCITGNNRALPKTMPMPPKSARRATVKNYSAPVARRATASVRWTGRASACAASVRTWSA